MLMTATMVVATTATTITTVLTLFFRYQNFVDLVIRQQALIRTTVIRIIHIESH